MIIAKLREYFGATRFSEIRVNVNHIYLYYKTTENGVQAVILLDYDAGGYIPEQYLAVRRQVEDNFYKQGITAVQIVSLLCGSNLEQMKECTAYCDNTWLIDTVNQRLILYENQSSRLEWLYHDIEQILEGQVLEKNLSNNTSINNKKNYYLNMCNLSIIVINIAIFILSGFGVGQRSDTFIEYGAMYWPLMIEEGQYYRLFTYMFLHSGIEHILNNMLILFFIGNTLERTIGKWKYLIIYFVSGILAGIVSMRYNMLQEIAHYCVGASGAIFGVCGAVAYLVIVNKGRLEDLSKRQIILFVFLSLYGGFTSQNVDNAAHIGGLISGIILAAILYRKPKKGNV